MVGRHFVGIEITSDVKKSFIDGVDMDVFGGDVASINGKNSRANFNILLHTWGCNNKRVTWDFFENLKKAVTATDAQGLKGWGDGETNSFVGTCGVGNNKLSLQGIESARNALD